MRWVGTRLGLLVCDPESTQQLVFQRALAAEVRVRRLVSIGGMPHIVRTIAESNPPTGAASRQLLGVRAAAIRGHRHIGR